MFNRYNLTESGFDFKEIFKSDSNKRKFIDHVKGKIKKDSAIANVTVGDLARTVKNGWSPFAFLGVYISYVIMYFFEQRPISVVLNVCRTVVFGFMVSDALKAAYKSVVRRVQ